MLWQEIEHAYHQIAALPPDRRDDALLLLEPALRAEVSALLAYDSDDDAEIGRIIGGEASAIVESEPDSFGPWKVTGVLGHGGMGTVYLAARQDHAFEKKVAIKVLQHGRSDPADLQRFRRERSILATLEHPCIARLIDGGETPGGVSYIVMEYVEGVDLLTHAERARLPLKEKLRLFLRVCGALEYAHRSLVVHRDIKPSNILVAADGTPKVLDFGIARLMDDAVDVTVTRQRAMTPQYASPEQVCGRHITTSSDVYSLGLVLFELLTGRRPYSLDTLTPSAIERVVAESVPEPARLGNDLDNILAMALRKEPERRYAGVREFAEDIERFLSSRPVAARGDSLRYRTARFIRRNRMQLSAAALIVTALAAGLAAREAEAQRSRRNFNQARGLAAELLSGIDADLRHVAGSTEVRERIAATSMRYLQGLENDAGQNPALREEMANAWLKVGDLQEDLSVTGAAVVSYRKALRLAEDLRAELGETKAVLQLLAECWYHIGETESYFARWEPAAADLNRSLGYLRTLRAAGYRENNLAPQVFARLGRVCQAMQQVRKANDAYTEGLLAARASLRDNPTDTNRQHVVSALTNLSTGRRLMGDLRGARAAGIEAIELANRQYAEHPGSSLAKDGLVQSMIFPVMGVAGPLDVADSLSDAASAHKAVALAEENYRADPAQFTAVNVLALAIRMQCYFQARDGNGTAVATCRRSEALTKALFDKEPGLEFLRMQLARARVHVAFALLRSGDRRNAATENDAALRLVEGMEATDIVPVRIQILIQKGQIRQSQAAFEEALALGEKIHSADPEDLRNDAFLAEALEGLALVRMNSGNAEEAESLLRRAVALWDGWARRGYSGPFDQSHRDHAVRLLAKAERARQRLP